MSQIKKPKLLLYIHGFNSSGDSPKANLIKSYLIKEHHYDLFLSPTLANYPMQAYEQLIGLMDDYSPLYEIHIIASSFGGFLATHLCNRYQCKTVLLNPAVAPVRFMSVLHGPHINPRTGESFELTPVHTKEVEALSDLNIIYPHLIHVFLQTGDQLLDYSDAVTFYQHCLLMISPGGSHRFDDLNIHLETIFRFLISHRDLDTAA